RAYRRLTPCKGEQQRHANRDEGCQPPQIKRMQNEPGVALVKIESPALPEPDQQLHHGNDEGAEKHQATPAACSEGFKAAKAIQHSGARPIVSRSGSTTSAALTV